MIEKINDRHVEKERIDEQKECMKRIAALNAGEDKKALVVTYGCQQNENDSERIRGMLKESGYGFCESADDADIIIFNTCAVRENAELKVFGNLGALKLIKRKKPSLIIGVCGCMMQQQHIADEIRKKYKHVDMIFGTHALYTLPSLLYDVLKNNRRIISVEESDGYIAENMPIRREGLCVANISVMYGCNNFCSYCIVPYVRGRERSRSAKDIIDEVKAVASEGYKEVMFLGQNVNSYGKDTGEGIDFASLLDMTGEVDGIERIRFMSSHPKDFTDRLISVIKNNPKVCRQMHLPVQSGSDAVLSKMNRKYTRKEYLNKVKRLRSEVPDITLTTDIIVGFPTETNEDFEDTLSLIKEVRYDSIFSFIYSKREGTPAAKMDFVLTDEQIHKNFDRLLDVQNEISHEINESYIGRVEKVLFEGVSKTDKNFISGRTEGGKIVHAEGDSSLIGKICDVKINFAKTWFLKAEIVKGEK